MVLNLLYELCMGKIARARRRFKKSIDIVVLSLVYDLHCSHDHIILIMCLKELTKSKAAEDSVGSFLLTPIGHKKEGEGLVPHRGHRGSRVSSHSVHISLFVVASE